MISNELRFQLVGILKKIQRGGAVSLKERVLVEKYADVDPTISASLKRSLRIQREQKADNYIDDLLTKLDLGSADPISTYNPRHDDLGEWFRGAPAWIKRS